MGKNTGTEEPRKPEAFFLIITEQKPKKPSIMSTLSYAWNVHGTFNGEFMSASGTTASVDGIAEVHGTAGEGGPFNHSSWIWGGFGHYGLGYIKGGHKETPTEKYPFHMTRHWRGEDGAHIWSSHHVTGAEGAWAGDVDVVAEYFQPEGPIMKGLICGQYPSHWIATKRSDKEVDVWGTVTLKVEGGGTYTAYVHDVRYEGTNVNKRIQLVGSGFAPGSLMMWDGNKDKGAWIVKSYPQYALATPKGDRHIWYRGTFQFELNNGNFYGGYWEMDIHFRKPNPKMPNPYVVKFWPETWASKPHYWHFYEREEVEESTYDRAA